MPAVAGGLGQAAAASSQRTAGIGVRLPIALTTAKGLGQQAVAGQNGGGFVELLVHCRPAAPQIAVVHGRQIVVDQAVAVHHFDRCADAAAA